MADKQDPKSNPDANFRFAMSKDGMKLGVSRYTPPSGGKEPSVELLRSQVAAAGVRLPIVEEAAERILEAVEAGQEFKGITLVRGIPATEPREASTVVLGNLDFPVFPEDRFVRFRPARNAEPGETIDGRPLAPKNTFIPEKVTLEKGDNVEWDQDQEAFFSRVWGMARIQDGVVSVEPIPRIPRDSVMVTGNLHHQDFKGEPITPARIDKEMRDMGVVIDLDLDKLDALIKKAEEAQGPLLNQVLVMGTHPVPGRAGWLEYLVATREDTGTEDAVGRLDFRNRGTYPMVNPDQLIGRLHPPSAGEGGIDIYGKTIPANSGRELRIRVGENVTLHDDGVTFQSKTKGVVVMDKSMLSVTECLIIPGNVDLNSGNVKVEHGSVKIKGSIQAGFSVSAPEHVIVEGSIESAEVYAGGQVEVSGGILMPDGGLVESDGQIIANYAANARIKAGGDVFIANEIQNSSIQTKGMLYATSGKGTIQGGLILTRKGMEVNEVGSELGVTTTVSVFIETNADEELRQERAKVTEAIKKIDCALGTDSATDILARTPPEKRPAMVEVLMHKVTLINRRKVLSEEINKLLIKRQEEMENVSIKVLKLVHPGTIVRFGTMSMEIDRRMEASTFYWDARNLNIAIR